MELDSPHAHGHSSQEFAAMEGFRQMVIGPRFECFDKTIFVGAAS